jgi:hypothetical protein
MGREVTLIESSDPNLQGHTRLHNIITHVPNPPALGHAPHSSDLAVLSLSAGPA